MPHSAIPRLKRGREKKGVEEDWRTPRHIFDGLQVIFNQKFDIDLFASDENALCQNYYTADDDSLQRDFIWAGTHAFANPPYARTYEAVEKGIGLLADASCPLVSITYLIPAHVQNLVWHNLIWDKANSIVFYRGLIKFEGPLVPDSKSSAMFASAAVRFTREKRGRPDIATAYALTGERELQL